MNVQPVSLPPGVGRSGIEIVYTGELTYLCNGLKEKFENLSINVLTVFAQELDANREANLALDAMGMHEPIERLKQYVTCNYGGYDGRCDVIDNQLTPEYWNCGNRSKCPYEGKLCRLLTGSDKITPREVEVMKSIASGMPDKQIADELGISFYTVRNHIKALYKKTSCHNKAALIVFAKNNNVV